MALGALALVPAGAAHAALDPTDSASPLDLREATLRQEGRDLVFRVRTRGEWASRALTSRPGRSLCLVLTQGPTRAFACASATASGGPAMTLTPAGGATAPLRARLERPDLRTLAARFAAADAGLRLGALRWTVTSTWVDSGRCAPGRTGCGDRLPDRGSIAATLAPPTPTGCVPSGASLRSAGPRARRVVALTFDDGPGPYTPRILGILRRARVPATFFVVGQEVRGDEALLRRALRDGHALANHTYTHADVSGGGRGQMSSTQRAIRRATGYTPCVFRPPYGAFSSTTVAQARSLGMLTIIWDVDPFDWRTPGAGAIQSRVLGSTRPGSIVLLHDAGGPRGQTAAALAGIVSTLRRRGYGFVTVPQLLGLRPTYG